MEGKLSAFEKEWKKGISLYIGFCLIFINILLSIAIGVIQASNTLQSINIQTDYISLGHGIIAFITLILFLQGKPTWKWIWFVLLLMDVFAFGHCYFFSISFFINLIPFVLLIHHLHLNRDIMRALNKNNGSSTNRSANSVETLVVEYSTYTDEVLKAIVKDGRHSQNAIKAAETLYLKRRPEHYMKEIKAPSPSQKKQLVKLWNTVYPKAISYPHIKALEEYLNGLDSLKHTLVLDSLDNICAWYFDFIRQDERFFGLLVHHDFQGKGLGKQLLEYAKNKRDQLHGWVVDHHGLLLANGEEYTSPLAFYLKNGFMEKPKERWDTDKLRCVKVSWFKSDQVS